MSVHFKPARKPFVPRVELPSNRPIKPPRTLRAPLLLFAALKVEGRDDMTQRLQWPAAMLKVER